MENDCGIFSLIRYGADDSDPDRELSRLRRFLHRILDSLPDAFVATDMSGKILFFNRRTCDVTGFNPSEILGKYAYEVFYPAGKQEARRIMEGIEKSGGVLDGYETEINHKGGGTIPIIMSVSLFNLGEDQPRGTIGIIKDISYQKRLLRTLQEASMEDTLTGCRNRRFLYDFLDLRLDEAKSADKPLSLVMIDLDGFKAINDSYGHLEGDEVLKGVGCFLKEGVRESDAVCRFGGDEFCLVMPGSSKDGAVLVAERLREKLAGLSFGTGGLKLTMSTGG